MERSKHATKPDYNIHMKVVKTELARRGEDCSRQKVVLERYLQEEEEKNLRNQETNAIAAECSAYANRIVGPETPLYPPTTAITGTIDGRPFYAQAQNIASFQPGPVAVAQMNNARNATFVNIYRGCIAQKRNQKN